MLKKQLITLCAALMILFSGGCISMAIHEAYKEKHPPAPTTASFAELRDMKVLRVEVVDETKEKHVDSAELASAIANAVNNSPAIRTHSHVRARVDDEVPADGRLVVHLTSEEAGLMNPTLGTQGSGWFWKIHYKAEFIAKDGNVLGKNDLPFDHFEYSKKNVEELNSAENPWQKGWKNIYANEMADGIVNLIFVYSQY